MRDLIAKRAIAKRRLETQCHQLEKNNLDVLECNAKLEQLLHPKVLLYVNDFSLYIPDSTGEEKYEVYDV